VQDKNRWLRVSLAGGHTFACHGDKMSDKWTHFAVQPLAEEDATFVGELLQIVQGRYAGVFVRVLECCPRGHIRVQTVGLRSLIVITTLPRTSLARDSANRRYIMGISGFQKLYADMQRGEQE